MTHSVIGSVPAEQLLGLQIDLLSKLRSGAITPKEVKLFLKRKNPFTCTAIGIPTFCSVEIGTFKNLDGLLDKLMLECQAHFTSQVGEIILDPNFTVLDAFALLELVALTYEELGFSMPVPPEIVYERATSKKFQLKLVPPETGPRLLVDLWETQNDFPDSNLIVGMQTIPDRSGSPCVFCITHKGYNGAPMLCAQSDFSVENTKATWIFARN